MKNHNLSSHTTAKAHLVENVLLVSQKDIVSTVRDRLLREVEAFDTITYVYVANKSKKLVGVISVQELFAAKKTAVLKEVMVREVYSVREGTHQEKIALLAVKHHLKAIPVTDKNGIFKGVVPSDSILEILHASHLEDSLLSVGIHSVENPVESVSEPSLQYHLKKRFPWLILGLAGSMLTTFIVGSFDGMLEKQILLASFIPAIVYMSDAVGNQTQTVFIKALSLENKIDFLFYFFRETKVALVLGLVLSTIIFFVSNYVWSSTLVSFIFAFSLLMAVIGAAILAVLLPILLKKINIDPVVATGPLASVLRDIYSLSLYLFFASFLLRLLG